MFPITAAAAFAVSFTLWLLAVRACKIASSDRTLAQKFHDRDSALLDSIANQKRELYVETERYVALRQGYAYDCIAHENRQESIAAARAGGRAEGIALVEASRKVRKLPTRSIGRHRRVTNRT